MSLDRVIALAVGFLALPCAPALAAERFAAPSGAGVACTQQAPCGIQVAVESATEGDEVNAASGDYAVGADPISVPDRVTVRGPAAGPKSRIASSAVVGVEVAPGASVADLRIDHTGAGGDRALELSGDATAGGRAERLMVTSSGGGTACAIGASTVIASSVCAATGMDSTGVGWITDQAETATASLTNVTASAAGAGDPRGIFVFAQSPGPAALVLDAINVIARGAFDVSAIATAGSATIALANSNYDTENEAGATITDPGTEGGQIAAPLFVDAAAGDFHQQPTSPTVDAGLNAPSLGALDLDREARIQNATVDIGADELDNQPPDTVLDGPSGTISDPTPSFTYSSTEDGSSFECALDGLGFSACAPTGFTAPALAEGQHSFAVRATDAAGNVDPTPAGSELVIETAAPETRITRGPPRWTWKRRATFEFTSDQPGARFECRLDRGAAKPCASPLTTPRLRRGAHTFEVRAIGPTGTVDPSPAVRRWFVIGLWR